MMSKKYKNPPIVEALCEFQFIPSQPWDITIPGLLYEAIRDEFPEKHPQVGFELRLQTKVGGEIEQRIGLPLLIMQFFRSDKTALVQVGPDLLTINHLRPYPTWELLKPSILKIFREYIKIVNPKGVRRVVLRYINKIDLDQEKVELSDYLNYYPLIPNDLPKVYNNFRVSVAIPYESESGTLQLGLGTIVPEKPGILSLVLELSYVMTQPEGITFDEVPEWLEKAHTSVKNAFEACITDKCRNLFEEVK